jgi:hypothetical protein
MKPPLVEVLGAILLLVSTKPVYAQADGGAEADASGLEDGALEEARRVYEEAVKAYEARRYDEAIEQFKHANRLKPNPAFSFNIGVAYQDKGEMEAALRYFRDYLRQLPDASDRAGVTARIRKLEKALQQRGVQQVTVLTRPEAATITIDGEPVGISPWTGELPPGNHEVTASQSGYEMTQRYFDLPPDRAIDVQVTLVEEEPVTLEAEEAPPPPKPERPKVEERLWYSDVRPVTWGVAGVAVVSLGVSLMLEVSRSSSQDEAVTAMDPEVRDSLLDTAQSRRSWSDAFLLLGLGMGATSGALIYSDVSDARERRRRGWTGACLPDQCQLRYRCTF